LKVGDDEEENFYFQRKRFVYIHCLEAEAKNAKVPKSSRRGILTTTT
jgi:hypothetical protein